MNGSNDFMGVFQNLTQTSLMQVGLILVLAYLAIVLSQRLLPWLAKHVASRFRPFLLGLVPVLRLLIIAAAFILIIPRVIDPTFENLIALMGALGLALGFAIKDYVSSLIGGIVSLYEMPYRPGDWIEIAGAYGEVRAINMRYIEIVTPDDTVVTIPHLKTWDHLIFNANDGGQNLQCTANFYLQHRHDAAQVAHTLKDVALTSTFLKIEQTIHVVVTEKPWGTHYRLKAYPVDPRRQFQFITDLTIRGKAALSALGVEFAAMHTVPEQAT